MIQKLQSKMTVRNKIWVAVPDTNLVAQKFFHACGLKAVRVIDDRYLMEQVNHAVRVGGRR